MTSFVLVINQFWINIRSFLNLIVISKKEISLDCVYCYLFRFNVHYPMVNKTNLFVLLSSTFTEISKLLSLHIQHTSKKKMSLNFVSKTLVRPYMQHVERPYTETPAETDLLTFLRELIIMLRVLHCMRFASMFFFSSTISR